jgi:hypothetical protein
LVVTEELKTSDLLLRLFFSSSELLLLLLLDLRRDAWPLLYL